MFNMNFLNKTFNDLTKTNKSVYHKSQIMGEIYQLICKMLNKNEL